MPDITLKRGDVGRPIVRRLRQTITDEALDGTTTSTVTPLNLADADSVSLLLKDQQGSATGGGVCTITNAANGEVTYLTQTADVNAVRTWNMEWEITWAVGDVQTVPNESPAGHVEPYYTLAIVQDLG